MNDRKKGEKKKKKENTPKSKRIEKKHWKKGYKKFIVYNRSNGKTKRNLVKNNI